MATEDYDIIPFPVGEGELYTSETRAATWCGKPGDLEVSLYSRDHRGRERLIAAGQINQVDKARDYCHIWVHDGGIPNSMRRRG